MAGTVPEAPVVTPGQVACEAFYASQHLPCGGDAWGHAGSEQPAWHAAAEAVIGAGLPRILAELTRCKAELARLGREYDAAAVADDDIPGTAAPGGLDARSLYATWYPARFPDATPEQVDGGWDHGSPRFLAAWEAVSSRAAAAVAAVATQRDQVLRELAEAEERAEFLVADRDRERLAAEHHRRTCEELEGELAEARERIRAGVEALKVTLFRPGNGPAHTQALEVVPLDALLGLLGPGVPLDGPKTGVGGRTDTGEGDRTPETAGAAPGPPQRAGSADAAGFRATQDRAWVIKVGHGFNTTDVPLEFCLLSGEVAEAFDAWRKDPAGLGGELADAAIHLLGLAEMTGHDLGAEVTRKLDVIEARTYAPLANGVLVKQGDGTPYAPAVLLQAPESVP